MDFALGDIPFTSILSVAEGEEDRVAALTSASKTTDRIKIMIFSAN